MHKDMKGKYLHPMTVVVCPQGYLYTVAAFEDDRTYPVRCVNSCAVCYFQPEQLEIVTCVQELMGDCIMENKNKTPQLLSYYAPHRCIAEDTQDLYLGTREMRPLLSKINKVQILMRKQRKETMKGDEAWCVMLWNAWQNQIDELMVDIELLLREDVVANTKK